MGLTDTFVRQVKHSGAPAGDKHTDGQGLFLLVRVTGKYWRLSYRFDGKQKTLALGVYPAVSLYCRCTPAECRPFFRKPVSSTTSTPSLLPSSCTT